MPLCRQRIRQGQGHSRRSNYDRFSPDNAQAMEIHHRCGKKDAPRQHISAIEGFPSSISGGGGKYVWRFVERMQERQGDCEIVETRGIVFQFEELLSFGSQVQEIVATHDRKHHKKVRRPEKQHKPQHSARSQECNRRHEVYRHQTEKAVVI